MRALAVVFALLAVLGTAGCRGDAAPTSDPEGELNSVESTVGGIEAELDEP